MADDTASAPSGLRSADGTFLLGARLTGVGWLSAFASVGVFLGMPRLTGLLDLSKSSSPLVVTLSGGLLIAFQLTLLLVPFVSAVYPATPWFARLPSRRRRVAALLWLLWLAASVPGWVILFAWPEDSSAAAGVLILLLLVPLVPVLLLMPCAVALAMVWGASSRTPN